MSLSSSVFGKIQSLFFSRRKAAGQTRAKNGRFRFIQLESLEDRLAPAVITWIGTENGNWGDISNWSLGRTPDNGDNVVIPDMPGNLVITYQTGSASIADIVSEEQLVISGGTLNVADTIKTTLPVEIKGGSVINATIFEGTTLIGSGGVLDAVTINGVLSLKHNAGIVVLNGLQLNGTATLGSAADFGFLDFQGSQTLSGIGTLSLEGTSSNTGLVPTTNGTVLTIGSEITIRGSGGTIGPLGTTSTTDVGFINEGTILSDGGGTLNLTGNGWSSPGALRATSGSTISLNGSVANTGKTLALDGQGTFLQNSTVIKGGIIATSNGAAIVENALHGGTLDGVTINGDLIAVANAGALILNGLELNGKATLGSAGNYGVLEFHGNQTLSGTGTVSLEGTNQITGLNPGSNGTFITIGSGITVRGSGGFIGPNPTNTATDVGFINQGTILSDGGGTLKLTGTGWSSSGTLRATSGSTISLNGSVANTGKTLTLDGKGSFLQNSTVIKGGIIATTNGAAIVENALHGGTLDGVTLNGDLIAVGNAGALILNGLELNGKASLGSAGNYGVLEFHGSQTLSGTGTLSLEGTNQITGLNPGTNGTIITIGSGITVRGSGGFIGPNPTNTATDVGFINEGTILSDGGGTLNLTGTGWSSPGTLRTTSGSTISLNGSVANTGKTLTLDGQGSFLQNSTVIKGGIIATTNGAAIVENALHGGTLDGVTINGDLIAVANAGALILNGLELNGKATLGTAGNYGVLEFHGSQTLSGTGILSLEGTSANTGLVPGSDGTQITIGSGITVRGSGGFIGPTPTTTATDVGFINLGTILSDGGGTLNLTGTGWSSPGNLRATAGSTISLFGSVANTGKTLTLDGKGSFLQNSTVIKGGIIATTNGAAIVENALHGGTLDGVTINGDLIAVANAGALILNGLELNGKATLGTAGNYGVLEFHGSQTLSGTGILSLEGTSANTGLVPGSDGTQITIGPGITVRGSGGFIGPTPTTTATDVGFINQGTILSDGGGTLNLSGTGWSSPGTLRATVGSTISLFGSVANTGKTLTLDGKGSFLQNSTVIKGGIIATTNGAAIVENALHGGTLDGVTINGDLIAVGNAGALILNGLELNGKATLGSAGNYGVLEFQGNQTLSGTGILSLEGTNQITGLNPGTNGTVITIGAGITVRGSGGYIGPNPTNTATDVGFINQGTILSDGGGTLNLTGAGWSSPGILRATSGSTISLNGSVANTGKTLILDGLGSFLQNSTVIKGGIIATTNGAAIVENALHGGTLDGVTINGDLIAVANAGALILNGLELNGKATLGSAGNYGVLEFHGNQTLSGTGTLSLEGTNPITGLNPGTNGTIITIGSGITVRGSGGFIGPNPTNTATDVGFLNQGTILSDGGGTLNLTGTGWSSPGTLRATSGSTISLFGSVANTGKTLTLDGKGAFLQNSTVIKGGIIATTNGAAIVENALHGGTLDGVTINGDLIAVANAGALILNGLELNGKATLGSAGNYGVLEFHGNQTLSGTGTLSLEGTNQITGLNPGTNGTIITIGAGITVRGSGGYIGPNPTNTATDVGFINQGTIHSDAGGTLNLTGTGWSSSGTFKASNGGTLHVGGSYSFLEGATAMTDFGGAIQFGGTYKEGGQGIALRGGGFTFSNIGTEDSPFLLEAPSGDLGAKVAGFNNNSALEAMSLAGSSRIRLVDRFHSTSLPGAEAFYWKSLTMSAGAHLDLNGLNVYTRVAQVDGVIGGGNLNTLPDSGPIILGNSTPGTISVPGELDEWTFFGRAGNAVTVVINAGSPALSPTLDFVNIQILDAAGNILESGSSVGAGAITVLSHVSLPTDGIYRVKVNAAAGHSAGTGNYIIGVYNATADTAPLLLNQTMHGDIDNAYNSDRWTFTAGAGTQVRLRQVASSSSGIQWKLTGPDGFVGFTGISGESDLVTIPVSGNYAVEVSTGTGQGGNYSFNLSSTSQTTLEVNKTSNGTLSGSGEAQLYRVSIASPSPLLVRFDAADNASRNEIYVRFGLPPTRQDFDYRYSTPNSADQNVLIPSVQPGDWYVLVYGDSVPAGTDFTIRAVQSDVFAFKSSPGQFGQDPSAAVTITGAGFVNGTRVELLDAVNQVIATGVTDIDSFSQITSTFDLRTVATGTYSLRVVAPSGGFDVLSGVFQVVPTSLPKLETRLIMPGSVGRHANATMYIEYANTGTAPMAAPLIRIQSADADNSDHPILTLDQAKVASGFWINGGTSVIPDGFAESEQIVGNGATAGVLNPGEVIRVPVYYVGLQQPWNFNDNQIEMELRVFDTNNTDLVPWDTLKDSLRPTTIRPDAWDAIYGNLKANVGPTWGSFVQMLSQNATYLSRLGQNVSDVGELWSFEIQQAIGFNPVRTLASSVDAAVTVPGADLSFGRSYALSIDQRFETSVFGRGWSAPWQTYLAVDADGFVDVFGAGGSRRRFQPRVVGPVIGSGQAYYGSPGETGQLVNLSNGIYEIHEQDGSYVRYNAAGRIDFTQDVNGNRVTASYSGSQLVKLTQSSGAFIGISYNSAGLISGMTDSVGRTTSYTYDAANQYLLSVIAPDGMITSYTYDTSSGSARQNALLSVASGGVTRNFGYDARGRLLLSDTNGNTDQINFAYDTAGMVSVTDAGGGTTKLFYDQRGLLDKVTDPFGNVTTTEYGADLRVQKVVDPLGQSQSFTWCDCGSMTSSTDQLGNKTIFNYDYVGPNNTVRRMTSFTDARGQTTRYTYDTKGNLLTTIYPDGSIERTAAYDPAGNALSFINRRGQVLSYLYNAAGQVSRQIFDDGSFIDLAYDSRGNLQTIAEPGSRVTSYEYDSGDRLTKVTYPEGRYLSFTYDAGGRRATMTDQLGYVVRYEYDLAGRLWKLRDTDNNLIVQYTYDTAGRLSRKDNGNNTSTTYMYDVAGQVLSIVNRAPMSLGGGVNSQFDYTYDALGRRTSMGSIDGAWTYGYDATGQLTKAIFVPADGSPVPAQDLQYVYDAAGNRIRTIENGVTTNYATNNLNQYTQVGGDTLIYDTDGNLISRSGLGGNATYSYDQQSRLVRVVTPDGVQQFEYDAYGNRTNITFNGIKTSFQLDQDGNIISTFNSSDSHSYRYTYGIGLIGQINAKNNSSDYFDFDIGGNYVEKTTADGSESAKSAYDPFGKVLYNSENNSSYFKYNGLYGTISIGEYAYLTTYRLYDASTGRFSSIDPTRLAGGDINFYKSVLNNPTGFIDKDGLAPFSSSFGILVSRSPDRSRSEQTGTPSGPMSYSVAQRSDNGQPYSSTVSVPNYYIPKDRPPWSFRVTHDEAWPFTVRFPNYQVPIHPPQSQAPVPPASSGKSFGVPTLGAVDPNHLYGPNGYGVQRFVVANSTLPYRIEYENYGPGSVENDGQPAPSSRWATAPAQRVEITNRIPDQIDLDSFELTGFGFGDFNLPILGGLQNYQQTVSMTYNGQTFDVQFAAQLDRASRTLRIAFQSIDPTTTLPPDVLTGFLPPEDGTGRGKGFVTYLARAISGLESGTEIRNIALITFDGQTAIATNQIDPLNPYLGTDPLKEALVTLDALAPTSTVATLPAITKSSTIHLNWSGTDDAKGSGIRDYSIFVSENGGDFKPWLTGTTEESGVYPGITGNTYAFYCIATDNVGHVQPIPTGAQAVTTLQAAPPTSTMAPLAPFTASLSLPLQWSGTPVPGSAIASYDIFVSDNGAPFALFLDNTTENAATFTAVAGHTYRFYSIAEDDLGNREDIPAAPQAMTTIDIAAPEATVSALDAFTASNSIQVTWSGADNADGSGIASYSVFVSEDGGPFQIWLSSVTQTEGTYNGISGKTYAFACIATDKVGNAPPLPTAPQTSTTVDTQAPTASVSPLANFTASTSIAVNWAGSDNANGSGLANYSVFVSTNGGPFQLWLDSVTQTSGTYNGVSRSSYAFACIATDKVGNTPPLPTAPQSSTTIDTQAPSASVSPLAEFTPSTSIRVHWAGDDNVNGSGIAAYSVFVSTDGGPFQPWLNSVTETSGTYIGVSGKSYAFACIATDKVGNAPPLPTASQASTIIDTQAPSASVSPLAEFSPSTAIEVHWAGDDNVNGSGIATYSVFVSTDGGPFQLWLGSVTQTSGIYNGVSGKSYAFASIATDKVGYAAPLPTAPQASTTIDTQAPNASVSPLVAFTSSNSIKVSWAGTDNANGSGIDTYSVFVSIDGGPFQTWLDSVTQTSGTYNGVSGKSYAFATIATDKVGNAAPLPTAPQASTTVDTQAPNANVSPLVAFTSSNSIKVSWAGTDNANGSGIATYSVFVSIDGGPFQIWLDSVTQTSGTYNGVSGKSYAFASIATDKVGNAAPLPTASQASIIIDTQAPNASASPLVAFTSSNSIKVSWSGTDNANGSGIASYSVFVSIDGGPFQVWLDSVIQTSGTYNGVSGKSYAFASIATDKVGNAAPLPTAPQVSTTVDTQAPSASVSSLPEFTPSASINVLWSGTDSPKGSGIASYSVYVSENGAPFQLWLDSVTQTSGTYTGVSGKSYAFAAIATDKVGNALPPPTTPQASTIVDTQAPSAIVAPLSEFTASTSIKVLWAGTDNANGSGIASYSIFVSENGGPFQLWLNSVTQTSGTYTGVSGKSYAFAAIATDKVGNAPPFPTAPQASTIVDAEAPAAKMTALPATTTTNRINLSWSGSDNPGGSGIAAYSVFVSENGGAFQPLFEKVSFTSGSFSGVSGRSYGFYSVAVDQLGNTQPSPAGAQTVTKIQVAPPTSVVASLPSYSASAKIPLTWSGTAGQSDSPIVFDVFVSDNGANYTRILTRTNQTTLEFSGVNGHTYRFYSVAEDSFGNRQAVPTSPQAVTTIDSQAPTARVAPLPAISGASFTVSWSGTDNPNGSGIANYDVLVATNGGPWVPLIENTTQTSFPFIGTSGSRYEFIAIATDAAGNRQALPAAADARTTVFLSTTAQTFLVDNSSDLDDGITTAGNLSLREAIRLSNSNINLATDTILFAASLFKLGPRVLNLSGALPTISGSLKILGPGAAKLTLDGNQAGRILEIDDGSNQSTIDVTISGVSFVQGNTTQGNGGAIRTTENLTLSQVFLGNNRASGNGGAISNEGGNLAVRATTIAQNQANLAGGGLFLQGGSSHLTNVTISANSASSGGGGVFVDGGSVVMTGATITANRANLDGTGNETGGGVANAGGLALYNTIVAGNTAKGIADDLGVGLTPVVGTNNLIGDAATAGGLTHGGPSKNIVGKAGTGIIPIATILENLKDNGGGIVTHALVFNSPAIRAGSASAPGYLNLDQRRTARDQGPPDIGAYEVQHPLAPVGVAETLGELYSPKPSADANTAYVKGLYQATLLREPDAAGLASWVNALRGGTSREAVAYGFVNSLENRTNQVKFFYQYFLGREADAAGLSAWVTQLQRGADEGDVMVGFILSREFSGKNDNSRFLNLMYYALLSRSADPAGLAVWKNALDSGRVTRSEVVAGFLRSDEGIQRILNSFATSYLKRSSDSNFIATYRNGLQTRTATFGRVAARILSSNEFFNNASKNKT